MLRILGFGLQCGFRMDFYGLVFKDWVLVLGFRFFRIWSGFSGSGSFWFFLGLEFLVFFRIGLLVFQGSGIVVFFGFWILVFLDLDVGFFWTWIVFVC